MNHTLDILPLGLLSLPLVPDIGRIPSIGWSYSLPYLGGAGMVGTLISTFGKGWPTGPFIVIAASSFFMVSLAFGLRKGLLVMFLQQRAQKKQLGQPLSHQRVLERGEMSYTGSPGTDILVIENNRVHTDFGCS
jgi:manganese/zinc/iron transport system permease protein